MLLLFVCLFYHYYYLFILSLVVPLQILKNSHMLARRVKSLERKLHHLLQENEKDIVLIVKARITLWEEKECLRSLEASIKRLDDLRETCSLF